MNFFSSLLLALPLLMNTASVEKPDQKPATVIHLDAGQAAKIISIPDKKKRPTIIDIRTLGEFKAGHLESALSTFSKRTFQTQFKLLGDEAYLVTVKAAAGSNSLKLWRRWASRKLPPRRRLLGLEKAGLPVAK